MEERHEGSPPPVGPSLQRMLLSYLPVGAVFTAIALFVALVPSTPVERVTGGGFDGTSGSRSFDPATSGDSGADPGTGSTSTGSTAGGRRTTSTSGGAGGTETEDGFIGAISEEFGAAPAGFDCSRNDLFQGPTCRPPTWTGTDNGGRTYRGVTADAINVVLYVPQRNEQVDAILAAAGTPTAEQRIDTGEAFANAFNAHYELYGREINYIGQWGPNMANDPQGQIADAQYIANELDAFYVITASASEAFYTELARLGVPSFNLTDQYPAAYMDQQAPFVWSVLPDLDVTLDHVAEYWCKRAGGKDAIWAGDPLLQGPRKLGLLYPDTNDAGPRLADKIASCGGSVDGPIIQYASDIAQATQTATNAIAQLKDAGVNIVACLCDPVAPVFFTSEATKQAYFPEWLQNGIFVTDSPAAGRLYDQTQWGRSWGISVLSPYRLLRDQARWHVYWEGGGEDCESASRASSNYYQQFLYGVSAMEAVGPNLTVDAWARAMFEMPVRGVTRTENRLSFGQSGPGPFSAVDNAMEHWWDPNANGPDGKPGYSFYVESGLRHDLGQWPEGDPNMFVDDGSEQVRNDPDTC